MCPAYARIPPDWYLGRLELNLQQARLRMQDCVLDASLLYRTDRKMDGETEVRFSETQAVLMMTGFGSVFVRTSPRTLAELRAGVRPAESSWRDRSGGSCFLLH
jgi:hypothetical protein